MMHPQHESIKPPRLYWGGVTTLLFGMGIACVFLVIQILIIGIFTGIEAASQQAADVETIVDGLINNGFVLSIGSVATTFVCVPLIFLIIKLKQGVTIRKYLGIRFIKIKAFLPWAAMIVLFLVCYDLFTHAIGRPIVPEFMITAYKTAKIQPLFWTALIVMAPVSEEIFFRGFLLKGFQSTFLRPAGAILLTSLLWAVIHTQYDYYDITAIFIMGVILGFARIKSKSILTTIYLHAFMNLVATIETAVVVS
ncbi:MAG: CPBP family intramembrane metalloprotease [Deltaproteobacteria bacterium]|nr:CPBP family intramembrane metalloprotease [Deltaproteobacteria bacterium]